MEDLLELTQKVFSGKVKRADLGRRAAREQVFVALAIMLADRQNLHSNNQIKTSYTEALERLLLKGVINVYGNSQLNRAILPLQQASRDNQWHRTSGSGRSAKIVLTPPNELVELVSRLGRTPAVDQFLKDADDGDKKEQAWHRRYRTRLNGPQSRSAVVKALNAVEDELGLGGLLELKEVLEERLSGL